MCSSGSRDKCCRLSPTCTTPYTHAHAAWDGYLKIQVKAAAVPTSESTSEPTSEPVQAPTSALSNYIKTPGSNSVKSYCLGSYTAGQFDITDPEACAAQCNARDDCLHFVMCSSRLFYKCCRLSST